MEKIVSTSLYGVKCVIGQSTRMPNTITMRVDRVIIKDAVDLYDLQKEDETPKSGLLGFKLVAVYADGEEPVKIEIQE